MPQTRSDLAETFEEEDLIDAQLGNQTKTIAKLITKRFKTIVLVLITHFSQILRRNGLYVESFRTANITFRFTFMLTAFLISEA